LCRDRHRREPMGKKTDLELTPRRATKGNMGRVESSSRTFKSFFFLCLQDILCCIRSSKVEGLGSLPHARLENWFARQTRHRVSDSPFPPMSYCRWIVWLPKPPSPSLPLLLSSPLPFHPHPSPPHSLPVTLSSAARGIPAHVRTALADLESTYPSRR
jgi:hypothetical protein